MKTIVGQWQCGGVVTCPYSKRGHRIYPKLSHPHPVPCFTFFFLEAQILMRIKRLAGISNTSNTVWMLESHVTVTASFFFMLILISLYFYIIKNI